MGSKILGNLVFFFRVKLDKTSIKINYSAIMYDAHMWSTWAEINWNVNCAIKSTVPTTYFEDYVESITVS